MATMNGSTAASGTYGGWRAFADYTVTITATSVRVTVTQAGMRTVNSGVEFYWDAYTRTPTLKVGADTRTNNMSYYQGEFISDREYQHLCTTTALTTARTWTFDFARSKADSVKTVAVSVSLPSGFMLRNSSGSTKSVASTSSSGTISVTVPALDSKEVSLDVNGGVGDSSATKWYGEALSLPQPVRDGYRFDGWALEDSPDTVAYQPGASYTSDAAGVDTSLVAVWTAIISGIYIESLTAIRADEDGEPAEDGEYAIIECAWRVEGAKAATVSITATLDTSPSWTKASSVSKQAGDTLRGTSTWFVDSVTLNVANRYVAQVSVSADEASASMSEAIGIAFITIDVKAGGKGIAFGKAATTDGLLEVGNMDVLLWQDARIAGDIISPNFMESDVAGIIVPESGVNITYARALRWGSILNLAVNFTFDSALSVSASGNIANIKVGTLTEGFLPVFSSMWSTYGDNAGIAWGYVDVSGALYLSALNGTGSARTVAAGQLFNARANYILSAASRGGGSGGGS